MLNGSSDTVTIWRLATAKATNRMPIGTTIRKATILRNNCAQAPAADLKYRNPYQASLDGNTVEMPVEQAAFSENNVRYQASLNFINLKIAELTLAINGQ